MVQIPCIQNNLTWAHEGVIKVGNSNDCNDRVSRPDLPLSFNKTTCLTLYDSQHILHIQQSVLPGHAARPDLGKLAFEAVTKIGKSSNHAEGACLV